MARFYNCEDLGTKNFTKLTFFTEALAAFKGEEVEDDIMDLLIKACEHEIAGIEAERAKRKTSTGPKNDLETAIGKDVIATIIPLLGSEPLTSEELIAIADQKGLVTSKDTSFSNPWVNRILKSAAEAGLINKTSKIVETVSHKGGQELKSQVFKIAYTK